MGDGGEDSEAVDVRPGQCPDPVSERRMLTSWAASAPVQ